MIAKNRYIVTLEFYMYADTDDEAINDAKAFVNEMVRENDNHCSVKSIAENNFGVIGSRTIYEKNNITKLP